MRCELAFFLYFDTKSFTNMKKLYIRAAALIAAFLCTATAMAAVKVTVDQVVYTLDTVSHTASATSFSGALDTDITIQATVNHEGLEYKVTTIGRNAFQRKKNITGVTIGPNVRTIMAFAFFECDNLKFANMNDSIEEIGDYAFEHCDLASFDIPATTISFGEGVLAENERLTKINLAPGNPRLVMSGGLLYDKISKVLLASQVQSSAVVPEGIMVIGSYAFRQMATLTSVTLPSTVTQIGTWAFYGTSITSVNLPEGLIALKQGCFRASMLKSVKIPSTLKDLGQSSFYECAHLKEITLPEGLEKIDNWALVATGLTKLHIPATVKQIVDGAIRQNLQLNEITVAPGNTVYKSENGFVTSIADNRIVAGVTPRGEMTVPEGIQTIGCWTFQGQTALTKLTLPSTLKTIEKWAFNGCENLLEVNLGTGVQSIDMAVFKGCVLLSKITFPKQLRKIGDSAFFGCISLPEAILNDGLGGIEMMAFQECKSLKKARIPGSVTLIGRDVFRSDSLLTEVILGEGLTKLGNTMFHSTPLASITLPSTLTQLNNGAFQNTMLASISLPTGLKSIGSNTFAGTRLSKIEIPASVTSIGKDAFTAVPLDTMINHAATPQKLTAAITSSPDGTPNYNTMVLSVPLESIEAYKGANIWKQYLNILPINNGVGTLADDAAEVVTIAIYDLQGRLLPALQKGLNICRMSDGTTRKVLVP